MPAIPDHPKFIQITAVGEHLHALDETGQVWRYYPAVPDKEHKGKMVQAKRFAFWGKITEHRAKDNS